MRATNSCRLGSAEADMGMALEALKGSRLTSEQVAKVAQSAEQTVKHAHVNEGG